MTKLIPLTLANIDLALPRSIGPCVIRKQPPSLITCWKTSWPIKTFAFADNLIVIAFVLEAQAEKDEVDVS